MDIKDGDTMKSFMNDKDGMSQKDFVLIVATVLMGLISLIAMIFMVMFCIRTGEFTSEQMDFMLRIIQYFGIPYCLVVAFYFLNSSTIKILDYLSLKIPIKKEE